MHQRRTGHACIWAMPGGPVYGVNKKMVIFTWEKVISEFFYDFARAAWAGMVEGDWKIAPGRFLIPVRFCRAKNEDIITNADRKNVRN